MNRVCCFRGGGGWGCLPDDRRPFKNKGKERAGAQNVPSLGFPQAGLCRSGVYSAGGGEGQAYLAEHHGHFFRTKSAPLPVCFYLHTRPEEKAPSMTA